jgi:hypothetical protein
MFPAAPGQIRGPVPYLFPGSVGSAVVVEVVLDPPSGVLPCPAITFA